MRLVIKYQRTSTVTTRDDTCRLRRRHGAAAAARRDHLQFTSDWLYLIIIKNGSLWRQRVVGRAMGAGGGSTAPLPPTVRAAPAAAATRVSPAIHGPKLQVQSMTGPDSAGP